MNSDPVVIVAARRTPLGAFQGNLAPEQLVDSCLDLVGPVKAGAATHRQLVEHAAEHGELRWDTEEAVAASTERVGELLQLIASVKEYQYN